MDGLAGSVWLAAWAALPQALPERFGEEVRPVLARHCFACHGDEKQKSGLNLEALARPLAAMQVWEDVRERLSAGEMPPESPGERPRPSAGELDAVLSWIEAALAREAAAPADPGRTTLRRLNRFEYQNTIRDLLGLEVDAEELFPPDDVGEGFDNDGDVLSVSPLFFERSLTAAEEIAGRAVLVWDPANPPARRAPAEELAGPREVPLHEGARALYSEGEVRARFDVPCAGEYLLRARAYAHQAGPERARMELRAGGKGVGEVEVAATREAPETYAVRARLSAGEHSVGAAFVNDYYQPDDPDPEKRDRNLYVELVELVGPLDVPLRTPFQERLMARGADPHELARELAERAWRRPVSDAEVARSLSLTSADDALDRRLQRALVAILASPHFLYRVELHPAPDDPATVAPLDDWALAARLSYFLWSSMPDAELFELARAGRLADERVLAGQVRRMLRDARASALVTGFADQWLQLRRLESVAPDPERYPAFDAELRAAMRAETEMLFDAVLREERSVFELVDPGFTFVNERLAAHYGIEGVEGARMRRVPLSGADRGGLLGQASILTLTSNPTRTSPVKRGKWVLEVLLDSPPDPPPAGVAVLDESSEAASAGSLRARLERHRADPACATCHAKMDALGFALEHFDAVGAWRARDGEFPVDASAALPGGEIVHGLAGLRRYLAGSDELLVALTRRLMTYALGRGLGRGDRPAVERILRALREGDTDGRGPTLSAIVLEIVLSDAFRKVRGERAS